MPSDDKGVLSKFDEKAVSPGTSGFVQTENKVIINRFYFQAYHCIMRERPCFWMNWYWG